MSEKFPAGRAGTWRPEPTKLKDLLPPGTEAEWICGHVSGAVCAECYRLLAAQAHELAEENFRLREELQERKV